MTKFSEGDLIDVPCKIQKGPFPDEKLVTVKTDEGEISGFVKLDNLTTDNNFQSGFVKGVVFSASADSITVQLYGSFFTTALGKVPVSRNNLRRLSAA